MSCDEPIRLDEQHNLCSKNLWCTCWSNRGSYYDNKLLLSSFLDIFLIKALFQNFKKNELANRCLEGFTQNRNEVINEILWNKFPKTRFCGKTKIILVVTNTVSHFHTGPTPHIALINSMSTESSSNMFSAVCKQEQSRLAVSPKKKYRKDQNAKKKVTIKNIK